MFKKIIILITLIILIGGFFIYSYPTQKSLAIKSIEEYMGKQGISKVNVESKQMAKDYMQGGYYIIVKLKDDPELEYQYIWTKSRGTILLVFKDGRGLDEGMKYPPLGLVK